MRRRGGGKKINGEQVEEIKYIKKKEKEEDYNEEAQKASSCGLRSERDTGG
jgi:hypothetical protein